MVKAKSILSNRLKTVSGRIEDKDSQAAPACEYHGQQKRQDARLSKEGRSTEIIE